MRSGLLMGPQGLYGLYLRLAFSALSTSNYTSLDFCGIYLILSRLCFTAVLAH